MMASCTNVVPPGFIVHKVIASPFPSRLQLPLSCVALHLQHGKASRLTYGTFNLYSELGNSNRSCSANPAGFSTCNWNHWVWGWSHFWIYIPPVKMNQTWLFYSTHLLVQALVSRLDKDNATLGGIANIAISYLWLSRKKHFSVRCDFSSRSGLMPETRAVLKKKSILNQLLIKF